ncbi:Protein CURVATURE THYLAKOID 1D [Carex littledalei]|uniref:Protein CURVATURE THYLAKOID 1D n=1 Tax=Carex littledalei TaxID=544730 RepID=A0A833RDR2_9POAL|nr:Protein CURVATURE THYLAKOID 1D [Carex littledalei]
MRLSTVSILFFNISHVKMVILVGNLYFQMILIFCKVTVLDSETTYKVLVYGSGVLAALLITSAVTSAIDSIPLKSGTQSVLGFYDISFGASM